VGTCSPLQPSVAIMRSWRAAAEGEATDAVRSGMGADVLDDFVDWLQSAIDRYGLTKVMLSPVPVVTLLGALGVIADRSALRVVLTVALLFIVLVTVLSILLVLNRTRHDLHKLGAILQRNSNRLLRDTGRQFRITSWKETLTFSNRGNLVATRHIDIEVTGTEVLLCRQALYPSPGPTMSERSKRRVKVVAYQLHDDDSIGARYDYTTDWMRVDNMDKHQLQVHFPEPITTGESVRIFARWDWPEYSRQLVDGGLEDFTWKMLRPVNEIVAEVIFERGSGVRSVTVSPVRGSVAYGAVRSSEPDKGKLVISARYLAVPADTPVGFRIDAGR
jgi:hypothetical protein